MKRILLCSLIGIFCLMYIASAQVSPESPVPSDAEIRKILADRLAQKHQTAGIVVGMEPGLRLSRRKRFSCAPENTWI